MRAFGLEQLTVETAGQSGAGALVSLTGVVDARAFREAVLAARSKTLASFFGRGGAIFFVVRRSRIATNTLPPRSSNLAPPRSKSRGAQFLNGLLEPKPKITL